MKHSDFRIGLEFIASAGRRWRCTDVGTRTVAAIPLDRENPDWYRGPPYIAGEVVFDELEMICCHLTTDEALIAAARERETSGHPGYPLKAVQRMIKARRAHHYPHEDVLRFDRLRNDGEILTPYAGRKQAGTWMIDLYLPFLDRYGAMTEDEFIALPRATALDIRSRADRAKPGEAERRLQQLGGSDPGANAPPRRRR